MPCIAIFSIAAFFVFRNQVDIKLIGNNSLGAVMLVTAVLLCVILFPPFYIIGVRTSGIRLSKKAKVFNTITLCIAFALLSAMITALIIALLNFVTKGIKLDRYLASAIVGVYAGLVGYTIAPAALDMTTTKIVRIFSTVIIAGMILSMITAGDSEWWQVNFSALGTASTPALASSAFNITLIISGLLLISLTSHLTKDIPESITGEKDRDRRLRILEAILIFMGGSMAAIGALPYDKFPRAHDTIAYFMAVTFLVLVLALKFMLPKISKVFLVNSYFTLAVIILLYVLFINYAYINLTAFELLSFLITLGWLLMFANRISKASKNSHG